MPLKINPNKAYRALIGSGSNGQDFSLVSTVVDELILRPVILRLTPEDRQLANALPSQRQHAYQSVKFGFVYTS